MWTIRPIQAADSDHLWTALKIAAAWQQDSLEAMPDVRDHLTIRRYADGWGRRGDDGVLAESANGGFAGACWFRLFEAGEVWGAVDPNVPVLVFAVAPAERRKGLGSLLLRSALATARHLGFERLSLSVARQNQVAIAMYEAAGFTFLAGHDDSQDMIVDLASVWSPGD